MVNDTWMGMLDGCDLFWGVVELGPHVVVLGIHTRVATVIAACKANAGSLGVWHTILKKMNYFVFPSMLVLR